MYRPADIETIEDFNQYYRGAFIGWLNPEDNGPKYIPCYVQGVDGRYVLFQFETNRNVAKEFKEVLANGQFGSPQYGSTEIKAKTAVYISRRSSRNAARGHRAGTAVSVHVFHPNLQEETVTDWPFLTNLFNPVYRDLTEAWKLLSAGDRYACSISRHLTLALAEGIQVPVLYYGRSLAGYMPSPSKIEVDSDKHKAIILTTFPKIEVV